MEFIGKILRFIRARYAPRGARTSFSASGEDIVVSDILKNFGIERPFYIDIGAHHPVFGNNTYLFYKRGASGVLVEPNTALCAEIRSKRPRDICINAGAGRIDGEADFYSFPRKSTRSTFSTEQAREWEARSGQKAVVEKRKVLSLDSILDGREADLVSIDAEGLDIDILSGFSWKSKPRVFCVEYSEGVDSLLESHGYELKAKIFQNDIYSLKQS